MRILTLEKYVLEDDIELKINWKQLTATLTSALTILAALPYSLGDLASIIPPRLKGCVVIAGLIATTVLRSMNAVKPPQP